MHAARADRSRSMMPVVPPALHSPPRPLLVLVGGPPGSGKTTLAFRLGVALALPVLSRDAIKDGLAESRRVTDPIRGRELAEPTFALFYGTIGRFLDAGCSLVAEHAFLRGVSERELAPLTGRARTVVIHCHLDREANIRRCATRLERGARHHSHPDAELLAQMRAGTFAWDRFEPPHLDVPTLIVDTSDGYTPDLSTLIDRVRAASQHDGNGAVE